MIHPKSKRKRVTLSLNFSDAREVELIIYFNPSRTEKYRMTKDDKGVWKKILILYPGRYKYKFMVDGRALCDPENDRKVIKGSFDYRNKLIVYHPWTK